ncbi:MAG: type II toxin-antitoxin system VapC family toxin [Chloroflexi bacterium]|nr:type II toxin-antitoxin system VapC family toxin [Candidatus Atribacteria bacterium]MCX6037864.1 type II toxin-antitoxin system VapC family toxin [Chloroflexota bacterium]
MSDYLLDSGILIRHLRDQIGYPELTNRLMDEADVYISAMTRLEIVRGMLDRERGETFDLLDSLETIPMTAEIADLAGEIIRSWRARGAVLGDADAVIAASALHNNLALVTTNARHFPMPELVVLQADEEGALTPRA